MKILRSFLIYGMLVFGLTACPFLEPPAPLAPLPIPKVKEQKDYTSLTTACRVVEIAGYIFKYDNQNRVIEAKDYENTTISLNYNNDGYLLKMMNSYSSGQILTSLYEYDPKGLLAKVETISNKTTDKSTQYYSNGRLIKTQYYNSFTKLTSEHSNFIHDSDGRIIQAEWGSFMNNRPVITYYKYDERGNRIEESDSESYNSYSTRFDDKPNPLNVIADFKGFPKGWAYAIRFFGNANIGNQNPNNPTWGQSTYWDNNTKKIVTYGGDSSLRKYKYNRSAYPISYQLVNGGSGYEYPFATYEGCIQ